MTSLADEIALTDQQRAALELRDHSVSLSAGAGCGKTFVLTERFLSHVDPSRLDAVADLQELVAITFTDAAAREMRQRIRTRCYERLRDARDASEAAAWQRLMRAIEDARISTIHSFCTALLREHYVEAGLDPQFQVLDAPTADLLRLRAVDRRLQQLLEQGDQRVIALSAKFGLDRLRRFLTPWACDATLQFAEAWAGVNSSELAAHWREVFARRVVPAAACELLRNESLQRLRELADVTYASTERLRDHITRLATCIDLLEKQAAESADGEEATTIVETCAELRGLAQVKGICTKKDWNDPADYETYRVACEAARKALDGSVIAKANVDDQASADSADAGLELLRLAVDVSSAVLEAKAAANQLEFDDLLIQAHRLLTAPENDDVRRRAAESVRLLMVDEFQDTDPRQVAIVKAFCGDQWAQRGLFVVGDYKQSIYRFRDAQPRVFSQLREQINSSGRLALTTNFRSQPAIVDFVNTLFVDAFELPYESLTTVRPQASPTPAVEFLWSSKDQPDDAFASASAASRERGRAFRKRQQEARWIARRLRQMIDSREPIIPEKGESSGGLRPVELGDIAILMRSLSDVAIYEEALREAGLEYYLTGGHAFYAQQEIYDVLNLLRAVASRVDEISLAGALRSPMFALSDATLFWLVERRGSLNAALQNDVVPVEIDEDEQRKLRRAAETLRRLREIKDRLLVAELLSEALRLTGYDAVLLAEFLGPRKAANVNKIVELARSLDRHSPGDLPSFITQLSEFVARAPKEPLAATQSEGDVIRIMTIHYAKGLEFPVVVLPDLDRPNHPGAHAPQFHAALGPVTPGDRNSRNLGWELFRFIEDLEEREERKRLFYVACTRAADYLILASSVDDLERPKSDWLRLLRRKFDLATGETTAALPAGYAAPQIRVTLEEPNIDGRGERRRRVDLDKIVVEARDLIASGGAPPTDVRATLPADRSSRRRFSFSRLSGELNAKSVEHSLNGDQSDELTELPPSESGGRQRGASMDEVDPRELGTLVHEVLEAINFDDDSNLHELCSLLAAQYVDDQPEPAAAEAADMAARFLRSPRGQQLRNARQILRETEFLLPWPPEGEKSSQYLQGFIDCLYQDERGDWRLLDYKTNRVSDADVQSAAQPYELQMFVYRLACEQALGKRPVECSLHFLRTGAEHQFTWDSSAVSRAIDRISEAMLQETRRDASAS